MEHTKKNMIFKSIIILYKRGFLEPKMTFLKNNHDPHQKLSFYLLKIVNSFMYALQSPLGTSTHYDSFHHVTDNNSVSNFVQAITIFVPSTYAIRYPLPSAC